MEQVTCWRHPPALSQPLGEEDAVFVDNDLLERGSPKLRKDIVWIVKTRCGGDLKLHQKNV